jgi:hypothetical protein
MVDLVIWRPAPRARGGAVDLLGWSWGNGHPGGRGGGPIGRAAGDTLHNAADALTAVPLGIAFPAEAVPTAARPTGTAAEDLAGW